MFQTVKKVPKMSKTVVLKVHCFSICFKHHASKKEFRTQKEVVELNRHSFYTYVGLSVFFTHHSSGRRVQNSRSSFKCKKENFPLGMQDSTSEINIIPARRCLKCRKHRMNQNHPKKGIYYLKLISTFTQWYSVVLPLSFYLFHFLLLLGPSFFK